MNLSLSFTTYNSAEYILKQFCIDHFAISRLLVNEIVIRDDSSRDFEILRNFRSKHVKIFQNEKNLSSLLNRPVLVNDCRNRWVLLMDADNFLDEKSYTSLWTLVNSGLDENTIYCPDFARPNLSYKTLSNTVIDRQFAKNNIDRLDLRVLLNTGNYLVPRKAFLEVSGAIDPSFAHFTCDTIYFNYLWLRSGRKIHCVNGFEYNHTSRDDSFWVTRSGASSEKMDYVHSLYKNL
jgi:Glycosyl transferase family 2